MKKRKDINKINKSVMTTKLKVVMAIIFLLLFALIVRIFCLQFITRIDGISLKEKAYRQQTVNKIISPKRGTIYDTNGKALARSAKVDTVSINPTKIKEAHKEKVATALAEIFELDYNETLEKVRSNSSLETIAKKVEQDKIQKLQEWMTDNKLTSGINIDEDTKRYYPYNSLASHTLGFTGTDNQGLYGIELEWNTTLTGTSGKIVTSGDVNNDEITNNAWQYVEVENGSDLYLTLDVNIQNIVEKYLAQGVADNGAAAGGAIAMNPNNGDILAMATYPNYDLNTPFMPNTQELQATWDTLPSEEKTTILAKMWKDKMVNTTYEPGSTFKVLMSAIALEENFTEATVANDFNCIGYQDINGTKIHCWKRGSHGYQTLKQALGNSCNPAFMQLGSRIGKETLYKYFNAFGLMERTGIALPSESSSNFHDIDAVGPVELATISFGQRFEITPLQLITSISSIANDGYLVEPRIVKQVVNPDTNVTTNLDTNVIRQVVSEDTASTVREMMEYVVTDGGGALGAVEGYSIGGKTGTSQPAAGREEEGYTVSFVAISPTENPEIVLLVIIYNPATSDPYGSQICGPIVSNMLSEILPYMGMSSENADIISVDSANSQVTIPDITNKTVTEAQKILASSNLQTKVNVSGNKDEILVTEQNPIAGTTVMSNAIVSIYTTENTVRTSVNVPDLSGLTLSQAKNSLKSKNLNITYEGTGKVSSQSVAANTSVEEGTVVHIVLK